MSATALQSEGGEFHFGAVSFRDQETAQKYARQFQPDGKIEHRTDQEDD